MTDYRYVPDIIMNDRRYAFDRSLRRWYCAESPSWRERNILCYMILNSQLTKMAVEQGADHRAFCLPQPAEKKKAAKKKSTDKFFIKI